MRASLSSNKVDLIAGGSSCRIPGKPLFAGRLGMGETKYLQQCGLLLADTKTGSSFRPISSWAQTNFCKNLQPVPLQAV
jgi:hypothetical protein